ncbi:HPr-rel-A system PqqD family peptide chaperone [Roseateles sp. LKC17W]|uniref:HPr-rel-A system PqqD family peptide chaperone n=1 Tax=Pelomonas margarita TaxID=3299031 RepID=A0ABW7FLX8_9BURK
MPWRLGGLTALRWRHLDGDWVIYDTGSGQTLAVDALMAAALMALESGCSGLADIEAQVCADLGVAADAGLRTQLQDGLAFFEQLGLVESLVGEAT